MRKAERRKKDVTGQGRYLRWLTIQVIDQVTTPPRSFWECERLIGARYYDRHKQMKREISKNSNLRKKGFASRRTEPLLRGYIYLSDYVSR